MRKKRRAPNVEDVLVGKVIVQNLPRRPISRDDIHGWLEKYGSISDVAIYEDYLIVQFESDLEAAGAVQCEDGTRFFGTVVSVKHAELNLLNRLRHSGSEDRRHPVNRNKDRDRTRGRTRDESPRSRYNNSSYDRHHGRDTKSPRRHSRSPLSPQGSRRHVHPLNWLSEVSTKDSISTRDAVDAVAVSNSSGQPLPPYTFAIVAVQHDLVPYAETIEKRITSDICLPEGRDIPCLRTHIVVLLSVDHLTPCLTDLTRDRIPFAIICTNTNWIHGSCTVRILYVPTQQEHRNMPLDDAITLLKTEIKSYLLSEGITPSQTLSASGSEKERDAKFLAPSRNLVTLLRMLANSRILSIGELDEIASFVQERKRLLEGRRLEDATDTRSQNTVDLKARILSMLYPQASGNTTPIVNPPASGIPPSDVPLSLQSTSAPIPMQNRFPSFVQNPVQQALDAVTRMPTAKFPQSVTSHSGLSQNVAENASAYSVLLSAEHSNDPLRNPLFYQMDSKSSVCDGPANQTPKNQGHLPTNAAGKQSYDYPPRTQPINSQRSGSYQSEGSNFRQLSGTVNNKGLSPASTQCGVQNKELAHGTHYSTHAVVKYANGKKVSPWARCKITKPNRLSKNNKSRSFTIPVIKNAYSQPQLPNSTNVMSKAIPSTSSVATAYGQGAYGYPFFNSVDGHTGLNPSIADGGVGYCGQSSMSGAYPLERFPTGYPYSGQSFY